MATNLGSVWVELELDTRKAERELEAFEQRRKEKKEREKEERRREREERAAEQRRQELIDMGRETGREIRDRARGSSMADFRRRAAESFRLRLRGKMLMGGGRAAALGAAGARLAQRAGPGTMLRAVGKVGMVATIAYGAASIASRLAPLALQAGAGKVPASGPLAELVEEFRQQFALVEARIKALWSSIGEANQITAAGARIGGELPDWGHYYARGIAVNTQQNELKEKFNHFKRMEVAGAFGETLQKAFVASNNR